MGAVYGKASCVHIGLGRMTTQPYLFRLDRKILWEDYRTQVVDERDELRQMLQDERLARPWMALEKCVQGGLGESLDNS